MNNNIFIVSLIVLLCDFVSYAQLSSNFVEVHSYSIGQGLSQKMIQNMVQDEDVSYGLPHGTAWKNLTAIHSVISRLILPILCGCNITE